MGNVLKRYNGTNWEAVGGSITGDTLPIGSEVDYIGENVPAGWEEVDSYSTSEINTGQTWIDGKPIYRISINISNITTYNNYVSTGVTISDIDNVIDIKSAAKRVPDTSQPNNAVWYITGGLTEKTISADYVTAVRIASGDVQYLANASSYRIVGMNITIEYTKTTD